MSIVKVAKQAGVSYATAWNVINGRENFSKETVAAVTNAAKKIGFSFETRRRFKQSQKNDELRGSISLLHFRPLSSIGNSIIYSIQNYLSREKINLSFAIVKNEGDIPPAVQKGEVSGILGYGEIPSSWNHEILQKIPTVWMMSHTKQGGDLWGDRVATDNFAIGALAARSLLDRGHTHLALMDLVREVESYSYVQRWSGFETTAKERSESVIRLKVSHSYSFAASDKKLPFPSKNPIEIESNADQLIAFAENFVDQWLALKKRPTGVFVNSDRLTSAVYSALQSRKIKIGKEIDIVSCDRESEYLNHLKPTPPSIDINPDAIAQTAVERLLWRLSGKQSSPQALILIPPSL